MLVESQLAVWANRGATVSAQKTHESVRLALLGSSSPLAGHDFEIYLQGSYRNDTNIYGDMDVDIVVQLNETFTDGTGAVPALMQGAFRQLRTPATYFWHDFRSDVISALRSYYGSASVIPRNKCVEVIGPYGMSADVIPAIQYRLHLPSSGPLAPSYLEGIAFWTHNEGRMVINYPKLHYENGVYKNSESQTGGWFKPSVRVFKNLRNRLVLNQSVPTDAAPSYFVQCLLYNVPSSEFGLNYQSTVLRSLTWLLGATMPSLVCQNGLTPLFGTTPEQWSVSAANDFLLSAYKLVLQGV